MRATKKQSLYFRGLLVLAMLLCFTGCEQKKQAVEESPASIRKIILWRNRGLVISRKYDTIDAYGQRSKIDFITSRMTTKQSAFMLMRK